MKTLASLKKTIAALDQDIAQDFTHAKTLTTLEEIRLKYLSRQGALATIMETLKDLSIEEKREIGPLLNALKSATQERYFKQKAKLESQEHMKACEQFASFDVTASHYQEQQGSLHVFTKLIGELESIFVAMGFSLVKGPEVETDYYNFEALNIPPTHPARELHDTFWLTLPDTLLRTHTSTTQIHAMAKQRPPLAIFSYGRCFRNEATDATHDFMFMQYELLMIDKDISVAHLIATAQAFLQALFPGQGIKIRVRPGYFPFVEPGLEIDASCPFCKTGCSVCKKTGWIELLGSGLIHPKVLEMAGIDPQEYSGFALGGGLERLAMLKYGITDIRLIRNSPISFLEQWS